MLPRSFMRILPSLLALVLLAACDKQRLYEDNKEFTHQAWVVSDEPSFSFVIEDSVQTYDLSYNLRNSIQYEWDRIFVSYSLTDSTGTVLAKKLVYHDLFDPTGRPLGESGIGDLYDHQFLLLPGYRFPHRGTYTVRLTQFSRQDTLRGVLAVGFRVARSVPK